MTSTFYFSLTFAVQPSSAETSQSRLFLNLLDTDPDSVCIFSCLFFCSYISSCRLSLLYSFSLCSFCIKKTNLYKHLLVMSVKNLWCKQNPGDTGIMSAHTQIIRQKCITSDIPKFLQLSNTILRLLLKLNFSWIHCAVMKTLKK